jgi:hypothetical protein
VRITDYNLLYTGSLLTQIALFVNRALHGVRQALPHSPRKRLYISQMVGETLSLNKSSVPHQKRSSSLPEDVTQTVIDFYHQDGISRQAPGMRDVHKSKCEVTGKKFEIQNVRV